MNQNPIVGYRELQGHAESLKPFLAIRVTYDDGDVLNTQIRLSLEEAREYYVGRTVVYKECEKTGKEWFHTAISVEAI